MGSIFKIVCMNKWNNTVKSFNKWYDARVRGLSACVNMQLRCYVTFIFLPMSYTLYHIIYLGRICWNWSAPFFEGHRKAILTSPRSFSMWCVKLWSRQNPFNCYIHANEQFRIITSFSFAWNVRYDFKQFYLNFVTVSMNKYIQIIKYQNSVFLPTSNIIKLTTVPKFHTKSIWCLAIPDTLFKAPLGLPKVTFQFSN